MSSMLLEAKEVHTYYGASHILHGIDFHIRQGEGIALMGRNGMGKTTLIRSMMGLVKPRHGQVRVRGDEMTGAPTHRIAVATECGLQNSALGIYITVQLLAAPAMSVPSVARSSGSRQKPRQSPLRKATKYSAKLQLASSMKARRLMSL